MVTLPSSNEIPLSSPFCLPLLSSLSLSLSSSPSLNLPLIQESLATPSGYMFCISETL